jgi:hypothetical protein
VRRLAYDGSKEDVMRKLPGRSVEKRLVLQVETVRVHSVERSPAALRLVRGGGPPVIQTSTTTAQD